MNWEDYAQRFRAAASDAGKDDRYVEACLEYAKPIANAQLPIIYDEAHLAALVGYDLDYIHGVTFVGEKFYRSYWVRKKSGGRRQICEPLPSLKEIQRWILHEILESVKVSKYAKGFVRGSSIKHNARFHRGQKTVLSLDIEEFFPSIHRPRVYGVFRALGYSRAVAALLSRICTLEERLPQGAPTSPALSNIVARQLDSRIAGYAMKRRLRYTRYADDITISGDCKPGQVIRFIRRVVQAEGFRLNETKTRAMGKHKRQEVTGIVVNDKMHAPREMRRSIRQVAHYIEKFGLAGHLDHIGDERPNYVPHILGVANHVRFVGGDDRDAMHLFAILKPAPQDVE